MLEFIANTFVVFFVVVDPIGLAPIFAAMTYGGSAEYRRKMAVKGTFLATVILFAFVAGGHLLFRALGVGLDAFRIAGGILLFLLSMDMVFAVQSGIRSPTVRERSELAQKEDISVFPLAIPLIAGPGALTTVLLLMAQHTDALHITVGLLVLVVVLLITLGALLISSQIMRVIGETGANVISRVLGILLASLAVQFIIDGISGSLVG